MWAARAQREEDFFLRASIQQHASALDRPGGSAWDSSEAGGAYSIKVSLIASKWQSASFDPKNDKPTLIVFDQQSFFVGEP